MRDTLALTARILFLFSDTGGGHRSATEAIVEALHGRYGDRISTQMVDFLARYAPGPFGRFPAWYPAMVRIPQLWALGYRLSNGRRRTRLVFGSVWWYVADSIRRLLAEHPCDLVVATHPLILDPLLRGYGRRERPPLVTVVTDLVTTHAFWYHPETDLCLVPTEEARRRALRNGVAAEKVLVTGLPVATGFRGPRSERTALRAELGWPPDLPVALLVGGGEGMGPLGEIAAAVDAARLGIGLAVVVGRNEKLRARLDTHRWAGPTRIYGFVRNMPALMAAADVLLTKAGPGTVTEALNAGLPMILYGRLPGQEDGNVKLVTDAGAGVWAPSMRAIVSSLRDLVGDPDRRSRAVAACHRVARPESAAEIAGILASMLRPGS